MELRVTAYDVSRKRCHFGWAVKVKEELISGKWKRRSGRANSMDSEDKVGNCLGRSVCLGDGRCTEWKKTGLES